mmetsp:Transcript_2750/g.10166  ORF Transcript_2750/g.10166 Transcript_2750/m.10166 type:complete len:254 (+) Transcript_2750:1082-1843(+)
MSMVSTSPPTSSSMPSHRVPWPVPARDTSRDSRASRITALETTGAGRPDSPASFWDPNRMTALEGVKPSSFITRAASLPETMCLSEEPPSTPRRVPHFRRESWPGASALLRPSPPNEAAVLLRETNFSIHDWSRRPDCFEYLPTRRFFLIAVPPLSLSLPSISAGLSTESLLVVATLVFSSITITPSLLSATSSGTLSSIRKMLRMLCAALPQKSGSDDLSFSTSAEVGTSTGGASTSASAGAVSSLSRSLFS